MSTTGLQGAPGINIGKAHYNSKGSATVSGTCSIPGDPMQCTLAIKLIAENGSDISTDWYKLDPNPVTLGTDGKYSVELTSDTLEFLVLTVKVSCTHAGTTISASSPITE